MEIGRECIESRESKERVSGWRWVELCRWVENVERV